MFLICYRFRGRICRPCLPIREVLLKIFTLLDKHFFFHASWAFFFQIIFLVTLFLYIGHRTCAQKFKHPSCAYEGCLALAGGNSFKDAPPILDLRFFPLALQMTFCLQDLPNNCTIHVKFLGLLHAAKAKVVTTQAQPRHRRPALLWGCSVGPAVVSMLPTADGGGGSATLTTDYKMRPLHFMFTMYLISTTVFF